MKHRLTSVVVLNVIAIIGATTAGCIAGIIGFYIVKHWKTFCFPTEYPLNYDEVLADCKFTNFKRKNLKTWTIKNNNYLGTFAGYVWTGLEFSMLAISGLAAIINFASLIVALVGLCGPKKTTGLVGDNSFKSIISLKDYLRVFFTGKTGRHGEHSVPSQQTT